MVDARIISDKEYVNQWSAKIYSGKDFAEGQAEIYTEKKERVRSKSEKIIADMLYHKNIPYKYECPINLKGLGMIYPDFTCLRLADRKTILWEHLGMMTDPIYCQKAMKKIDIYAKNGFIQSSPNLCVHSSSSYVSPSMLPLSSGDLIEWSLVCHSTLSYQKFCDRHSNHYDHPEELHQSVE